MCHTHDYSGHTSRVFTLYPKIGLRQCCVMFSETQPPLTHGEGTTSCHTMTKVRQDSDSHNYQSIKYNFYKRGREPRTSVVRVFPTEQAWRAAPMQTGRMKSSFRLGARRTPPARHTCGIVIKHLRFKTRSKTSN